MLPQFFVAFFRNVLYLSDTKGSIYALSCVYR